MLSFAKKQLMDLLLCLTVEASSERNFIKRKQSYCHMVNCCTYEIHIFFNMTYKHVNYCKNLNWAWRIYKSCAKNILLLRKKKIIVFFYFIKWWNYWSVYRHSFLIKFYNKVKQPLCVGVTMYFISLVIV